MGTGPSRASWSRDNWALASRRAAIHPAVRHSWASLRDAGSNLKPVHRWSTALHPKMPAQRVNRGRLVQTTRLEQILIMQGTCSSVPWRCHEPHSCTVVLFFRIMVFELNFLFQTRPQRPQTVASPSRAHRFVVDTPPRQVKQGGPSVPSWAARRTRASKPTVLLWRPANRVEALQSEPGCATHGAVTV